MRAFNSAGNIIADAHVRIYSRCKFFLTKNKHIQNVPKLPDSILMFLNRSQVDNIKHEKNF